MLPESSVCHFLVRSTDNVHIMGSSTESRRFLVSLPNACGAAVVGRKYDFHLFHVPGSALVFRSLVPGSTHVFRSLMLPRFKRSTRALPHVFPAFSRSRHFGYSGSLFVCLWCLCLCRLVISVSVLVSVCYIDLLSVLVFREQNMVQRI